MDISKLPRKDDFPYELRSPPPEVNGNTLPPVGIKICAIEDVMTLYLQLLGEAKIRKFLENDVCNQLADRYILAMIFTFFIRAELAPAEFTPTNFFVALHLAHDVEEDNDELKNDIIRNFLGQTINYESYKSFMKQRDELWRRMKYRAAVSLQCCLKVIKITPHHSIWQRYRSEVHAGANRAYLENVKGKSERNDVCWHCNKLAKAMDGEESE